MSGRWWRAYGRARHDPKLLKLSDKDFRWWFNLVCAASDNGGVLLPCEDLAVEFRVSPSAMSKTLDRMVAAGLFDHDDTGIHPHNWNALQYVSDRSSERVKAFRERQRNVSVTPSETETDTEQNKQPNGCFPAEGGKAKRKSRLPEDFEATPERLEYAKAQGCTDPADTFARFKLHHQSKGTLALDWEKGWQYWCRNESNFRRPQAGKFDRTEGLPTSRDGDGQWAARVRGWTPGRFWNRGDWGPPPNEPGCRAPAHLLTPWRPETLQ